MKPTEKAQVEFIKDCLRKGEKKAQILAKFVGKWHGIAPRTFERRLKVATESLSSEIKEIEARAVEGIAKKAEAVMGRILSVTERQILLTDIALGKVIVTKPIWTGKGFKNQKCPPDHSDRTRALAELNKMGGDYGATKSYILGDAENPLPVTVTTESNIDYDKLPLEVLQALINAKTDKKA